MKRQSLDIEGREPEAFPVTLWDVFGEQSHPVRATISELGPLLLGRILNLNETQAGVLAAVFKIADENGLLLLDLKDLRALLQHAVDNAAKFRTQYGNISAASVGAIQRGLLAIESQGAAKFFGEPVLALTFKIADDNGVLLLNMKDLRAMLQHVGDSARDFTTEYGNISAASIGHHPARR